MIMRRSFNNQSGVALVVVMWVLLTLSIITIQICHAAKTNIRSLSSFNDGIDARSMALSAMKEARMKMTAMTTETMAGGISIDEDETPGGSYSYTVIDESGRLDINNAATEEISALLRLIRAEAPDTVAGRITRFRDRYPGGALSMTSELLNVNGIGEPLFTGEDGDGDMTLQPNENDGSESWPPDDGDGELDFGLERYVRAACPGKINMNRAPREVILAALIKYPEAAAAIAAAAGSGRITGIDRIANMQGITSESISEIDKKLTTRSSCYHITATGAYGSSVKEIEAYVRVDETGKQRILFWRET